MYWTSFITVFALPGTLAMPWSLSPRRASAATTGATLYAYGTNISGFPVLYNGNDGHLYISASNTTVPGLQSVTWDIPALTSATTTTTTATLSNGTSPGGLHLNITVSGLGSVSVLTNATTGITTYGKQLVYIDDSSFEAKFWARSVQVDGSSAWSLTWNEENSLEGGATPVNIKTDGPASASS
ncbi:hypothetical protein M406DRAFT_351651 [Cryphonectria parasitica EP155]|uniref:Uncharacterized protein n=1 Tax=Cryphonectria parasitica (strain ATCC 38755 / EP155) TaxID=660469 RepID=A0A9P4Y074_CRYP1|nr:uncharacterized protein M406DRAFT_351651 [Cryphonectria parasitica EP155]KAF3764263.1 hypothetical protein M406DRAFT_351651 [Cryphonectria parasitica EP155]